MIELYDTDYEGSDELFIKLDDQLGELVSSLLKADEILWEDDAYRDEYHRLRNSLMNLIHRVNTNK